MNFKGSDIRSPKNAITYLREQKDFDDLKLYSKIQGIPEFSDLLRQESNFTVFSHISDIIYFMCEREEFALFTAIEWGEYALADVVFSNSKNQEELIDFVRPLISKRHEKYAEQWRWRAYDWQGNFVGAFKTDKEAWRYLDRADLSGSVKRSNKEKHPKNQPGIDEELRKESEKFWKGKIKQRDPFWENVAKIISEKK